MSRVIRYTLVSEGSSDQILLHPIDWLLRQHLVEQGCVPDGGWADLSTLRSPPRSLAQKFRFAIQLYPCDLLFVHRDADNEARHVRVGEIQRALAAVELGEFPSVCLVPVRISEAWFLFNEDAIRRASGNPRGLAPLQLPTLRQIEGRPGTKEILYEALRTASELRGRRLRKFRPESAIHRLAELIADYSPLRELPAFEALEGELSETIRMRLTD